jgi:prepilin-type N-terminal cleavage/methylation domain-containing protein
MKQNGFTLLEVTVCLGIFSAAIAACFLLLGRADLAYHRMKMNGKDCGRAFNYMERLFSVDYSSIDTSGALKVVLIEPGLKLLYLTGEAFCVYAVRSSK